jgi:hypothetical protein
MADYTAKLKELLRANQCRFERQGKGDHEIWLSPITEVCFPVDSKIKSRHTGKCRAETGWVTQAVLIHYNQLSNATIPVWNPC